MIKMSLILVDCQQTYHVEEKSIGIHGIRMKIEPDLFASLVRGKEARTAPLRPRSS